MGYVYFIASYEHKPQLVKIGYTKGSPHARRNTLQTGTPYALDVLVYAPGTQEDERRLHERFAAFRKQGEWFYLEGFLQAYVVDLINQAIGMNPAPTLWTEVYRSEPGQ